MSNFMEDKNNVGKDNDGRNMLQQLTYDFFRWQFRVDPAPSLVKDGNNAKCRFWLSVEQKTGIGLIPCVAYRDHLREQGKDISQPIESGHGLPQFRLGGNKKRDDDNFPFGLGSVYIYFNQSSVAA
jgi:hypothetical protein